MLVSAPLYPRSRIFRAYGLCFSAEGIKGPVPCQEWRKSNLMEAASSPDRARAVTHETFSELGMKSIKHIKEKVTAYDNLYQAYLHARRNKRFRDEVLAFSANLEDNLHDLQKSLIDMTYRPGPYRKKVIHDPVDRLIMWQAFIHRVVQWAVYQIINPAFVRGYIEDSYA